MGTLYVVGTPIGNLEDATFRAVRVLGEVKLIAAEDTRRTRILLKRYEISTPVTSYFEANKLAKLDEVVEALGDGDVALVSEAGMPGLSDPGYELIRAAIERGHRIVPVPGPSAAVTALVASGLPSDSFTYVGFLPRRSAERRTALAEIAGEGRTLVAFEAPHRLRKSLADVEEVLGGDRHLAICRELTKVHEEIWRGTVCEARRYFEDRKPRGEFTLVIEGAKEDNERWTEAEVKAALARLLAAGRARPAAARQVAARSGWSRSETYELSLELE
jgi:16S rRNA (cytidine1402-2'-O)-methyltransferase